MKTERTIRKIFHAETDRIIKEREEKMLGGACPEAFGAHAEKLRSGADCSSSTGTLSAHAEKSEPTGDVRKPYYAMGIAAAAVLLLFGAVAVSGRFFGGNGQGDHFAGNYSESGEPFSSGSMGEITHIYPPNMEGEDFPSDPPIETETEKVQIDDDSWEYGALDLDGASVFDLSAFLRKPFAIIEIVSPAEEKEEPIRIVNRSYSKIKCRILFQTNSRTELPDSYPSFINGVTFDGSITEDPGDLTYFGSDLIAIGKKPAEAFDPASVPSSPDSAVEMYFPTDFAHSCKEYTHLFVDVRLISVYGTYYYALMDTDHCMPVINNGLVCENLDNEPGPWKNWLDADLKYKLEYVNKILEKNQNVTSTLKERFRDGMSIEEIESLCIGCEKIFVEGGFERKWEKARERDLERYEHERREELEKLMQEGISKPKKDIVPAPAIAPDAEKAVRVYIDSEEPDLDLSGVLISVYSAELVYAEEENEFYEYAETYAYTAITDKDGTAVFPRPTEAFSITIQTDTLPKGYGIYQHTKFFFPEDNEFRVEIQAKK